MIGVDFINAMLGSDFFGRWANWLIVKPTTVQAEQFRLDGQGQFSLLALDQLVTFISR
jgi:hypothetical protein